MRQTMFAFVLALFLAVPALSQTLNIMPMGDSITEGYDNETASTGGYRSRLFVSLAFEGVSFHSVGINDSSATPQLVAAGQQYHNGFGGWHCTDLNANLDGVANPVTGGDPNQGGFIITGGHGTGRPAMYPDILLLQCGTNDLLQQSQTLNADMLKLVTHFHALSPKTTILIAGIPPINNAGFETLIANYNSYLKNTLVPSLAYTGYVDNYSAFFNANGSLQPSLLGTDLIHPNIYGYPILAANWSIALNKIGALLSYR